MNISLLCSGALQGCDLGTGMKSSLFANRVEYPKSVTLAVYSLVLSLKIRTLLGLISPCIISKIVSCLASLPVGLQKPTVEVHIQDCSANIHAELQSFGNA